MKHLKFLLFSSLLSAAAHLEYIGCTLKTVQDKTDGAKTFLSVLTVTKGTEPVSLSFNDKATEPSAQENGAKYGLSDDINFNVFMFNIGQLGVEKTIQYKIAHGTFAENISVILPGSTDKKRIYFTKDNNPNNANWSKLKTAPEDGTYLIYSLNGRTRAIDETQLRNYMSRKLAETDIKEINQLFFASNIGLFSNMQQQKILKSIPTLAAFGGDDIAPRAAYPAAAAELQHNSSYDVIAQAAVRFHRVFALHDLKTTEPQSAETALMPFNFTNITCLPEATIVNLDYISSVSEYSVFDRTTLAMINIMATAQADQITGKPLILVAPTIIYALAKANDSEFSTARDGLAWNEGDGTLVSFTNMIKRLYDDCQPSEIVLIASNADDNLIANINLLNVPLKVIHTSGISTVGMISENFKSINYQSKEGAAAEPTITFPYSFTLEGRAQHEGFASVVALVKEAQGRISGGNIKLELIGLTEDGIKITQA